MLAKKNHELDENILKNHELDNWMAPYIGQFDTICTTTQAIWL